MKHLFPFVIAALVCGCDGTSSPVIPQEGSYTGFYDNQEVDATVAHVSASEIRVAISKPFNDTWDASWKGALGGNGAIVLKSPSGTQKFDVPGNSIGVVDLTAKDGSNTFQLSWSSSEIHWNEAGPDRARLASLDLTRSPSDGMPKLETPATYTLEQLMARAKARNFESVVEFQKVMIAKYNALNADLDLLPHANSADLFNILSLSLYSGLKTIGDLVPFILPSRWFRAAGAGDLLAAEKDAWVIMDLDGISYVEGFSCATARDAEAAQAIGLERAMIESLRDTVRGQERTGQAQIGASDPLSSLMAKTDLNTTSLAAIQSNESAALAEAAGFYNPAAVISVILPQDPHAPSVGHPLAVGFEDSAKLAISRSTELTQLDDLLAWARTEVDARFFDWMDPSGNTSGGIGLGLPAYIEAGKADVDEIVAQKEEKKAILLQYVQDAITELNKNVDDFGLAIQASDIQERRVLRQTENLKIGSDFDMNELVAALDDQVNSQLAQIDAEYGYLIALARFNRLLEQGAYVPDSGGS